MMYGRIDWYLLIFPHIHIHIYIYIHINIMRGKKDVTTFPDKPVSWIASLFRGLIFSSHNIYSALLQRIEHCSTRKSTCRLPIYTYTYIHIYIYTYIYINVGIESTLAYIYIYIYIYIFVYLCICLSVYLRVCLSVCQSIYLSIYLSLYLSIYWFIHLFSFNYITLQLNDMIVIHLKCYSTIIDRKSCCRKRFWIREKGFAVWTWIDETA